MGLEWYIWESTYGCVSKLRQLSMKINMPKSSLDHTKVFVGET